MEGKKTAGPTKLNLPSLDTRPLAGSQADTQSMGKLFEGEKKSYPLLRAKALAEKLNAAAARVVFKKKLARKGNRAA